MCAAVFIGAKQTQISHFRPLSAWVCTLLRPQPLCPSNPLCSQATGFKVIIFILRKCSSGKGCVPEVKH